MNNTLLVYVTKRAAQLCHPESYRLFGKGLSRDMESKIAAIHEVDYNVSDTTISPTGTIL